MHTPHFLGRLILSGALISVAMDAYAQNKCEKPLKQPVKQTLVVTDPAVFVGDKFSLGRTLGAILKTAVTPGTAGPGPAAVDTQSERVALLASLIRSFRVLDRTNPDSRVSMPMSDRPGEAALEATDLLTPGHANEMRPIALFNRLDLTPKGNRYCGEHRIVYAKKTAGPTDRFFLIFEAALDNPDPQNSEAGCERVKQFWTGLEGKSTSDITSQLENFYFEGELGDSKGKITAVVHHQHYGVPFGQIRGNLFKLNGPVGGSPSNVWMLREWRTSVGADGVAVFVQDTVKSNPHPDLYGVRGSSESQDFTDLRPEFQDNFVIDHVRELIELELIAQRESKPLSETELFAKMSARFENRFNTFESISQEDPAVPSHDPLARAQGTDLPMRIDADLKNFKLPAYAPLTNKHVLARAGALSCAGCHQLSVGQEMAPARDGQQFKWPATAGRFVHVKEDGTISPALEDHFLPSRCEPLFKPTPPATIAGKEAQFLAAAYTKTREVLANVQRSGTRVERLRSLPDLEEQVQTARRQDFRTPGAFIPFRRTH